MPLPEWKVQEYETVPDQVWPFKSVLVATCPRAECQGKMMVPKGWTRRSLFGTCGCPHCFKTARIPGAKYRTLLGRNKKR